MKHILKFSTPLFVACSFATSGLSAETVELSLAKVLELASGHNTELTMQMERVVQAELDRDLAWYSWIPDLRVGGQYSKQDGILQNTDGSTENVKRDSLSTGLGFTGTGSGLTNSPGLSLQVDLADAFFDPQIASRNLSAAQFGEAGTNAQVALRAAELYFDLMEARRHIELVGASRANADDLAEVTRAFAEGGEGLQSDSEQALVYSLILESSLEEAHYRYESVEAELARFLALDESIEFTLSESAIVPLSIYNAVPEFGTTVATALQQRPEIKQAEARGDAVRLMQKKEKWGPLVPTVAANYSYGEFEGDGRGFASESDDRTDYSVAVFWELDGLGFSNRAYSVKQASVYRQARAAEAQVRADVSSEVKLALDAIVHSEKQFKVLTRAVDRARRAYQLTRDRVFENHGEPLDALQSMRMLEDAEKMMVKATARYNLAQLRLLTVAGGVVDAETVQ